MGVISKPRMALLLSLKATTLLLSGRACEYIADELRKEMLWSAYREKDRSSSVWI
jgi:hypothetical protein